MKEVDIGDPSPSVFTRLEQNEWGRPVASFVSCHGEAFSLAREEVELRIRYLEAQSREASEERRALAALREAGG